MATDASSKGAPIEHRHKDLQSTGQFADDGTGRQVEQVMCSRCFQIGFLAEMLRATCPVGKVAAVGSGRIPKQPEQSEQPVVANDRPPHVPQGGWDND